MKEKREKKEKRKTNEATFLIPCGEFRTGGNEEKVSSYLYPFEKKKKKKKKKTRISRH